MTSTKPQVLRKEDPALLSGRGRYADDLPVPVGTLHAHVVRSPHPHADIVAIDASAALAHDGVWAVITGEDIRKLSEPFLAAVKTPVQQWALAVERVRYVGEPVALVVAESRYIAEDAAELVTIEYAPLEAVVDPRAACAKTAPLIHPQAETNEISVRKFSYGDTAAAFARADRRIAMTTEFPRLSFTPIECYVVVAEHNPAERSYDVLANFQGPFSMHPVMARALRVAGPKLRLRIPAGFRRQLWHKTFGVSLCGADRACGKNHRPAGEMGRGPHRASGRRQLGAEPRYRNRGGDHQGRPHPRAETRSARGLRRVLARADAGAALPHAWRGDRRLRHRQCRGDQQSRAHQQDAVEPHPRLRRAAALSGAGAADAAHRGGARSRSARCHPPQSHSGGEISLPRGGRRAVRFRRLSARGRESRRRRPARCAQAPARRSPCRWAHIRHRLCRHRRAGDVEHGLSLDPDDRAGARKSRTQERRGVDGAGQYRSARRGVGHRRRHGARAKPRDRAGGDRGPRARIEVRRCRSGVGNRHRQGSMVDRGRHLFEPLRLGHGGGGAHGRGADARQAQSHRRQAAQRAGRRRRAGAAAKSAAAAIPTTRCRSAGSPRPRTGRR